MKTKVIFLAVTIMLLTSSFIFGANVKAVNYEWQMTDVISNDYVRGTTLAHFGDTLYAAYLDFYTENTQSKTKIIIKKRTNSTWQTIGEFDQADTYSNPVLQIDNGGNLYVAYNSNDYGSGNYGSSYNFATFVKKYQNGQWQSVGNLTSSGLVEDEGVSPDFEFVIDNNDLYLAYLSGQGVLRIMKYTGNINSDNDIQNNDGWEYAWSEEAATFSSTAGSMLEDNFGFDVHNGNAYIAIIADEGELGAPDKKLIVYQYLSGWVLLDPGKLSIAENDLYLKAHNSGIYLIYNEKYDFVNNFDYKTRNKIVKYDSLNPYASSFKTIAVNKEFLEDQYNYMYFNENDGEPMAFDSQGNLYLVYGNTEESLQNWDNPWGSATVMKYDGNNWEYVGEKRFSEQSSMDFSILIDNNDEIYVICRDDGANQGKAVIYQYASSEPIIEVDEQPISDEIIEQEDTPDAVQIDNELEEVTNEFVETEKQLVKQVDTKLSKNLSGKIVLQVESKGEAWYVNPKDQKKYYMGRPNDAYSLMRSLGVGITNSNLMKIPVAEANFDGKDSDGDGLSDIIEDAFNTDKYDVDSDNDGFSDKEEVINGYNPGSASTVKAIDNGFASLQKGKIFLQVENNGEAWYINPDDGKRYFLGKPENAFEIMRNLGLGISNENLRKILVY